MSRPIDYLESAVSDRPHSQMDRLLFEDEMSQQPQHFMRAYQEGYDPAKAIAEGDFMPMGAGVKLWRGVPKWYRGQMVKEGKYLGGAPLTKYHFEALNHNIKDWLSRGVPYKNIIKNLPYKKDLHGLWTTSSRPEALHIGGSKLLEFNVPKSFLKEKGVQTQFKGGETVGDIFLFPEGLPKEYLKKFYKGYQQGGPAERPPLLGYMNPSVQDETAHSQMDRLMFENELEQQPQYSMVTQQEVYDPAQAWGEGMMPIGGMLRGGKGTLAMLKHSYGPYAKQSAHYRDILDKKLMNILKKYESQTRGRNIEKSLSTGAGQEATKEAMETDYIIQKLGGKYTN